MNKFFVYVLALVLLLSCSPCAFAESTSHTLDIDAGDTVHFGRYEQDNNLNNGPEEISWLVLERAQDRVLVISENVLDCKAYNDEYAESDWEKCSLRRWLNESFLSETFDPDEQVCIYTSSVHPDRNPDYNTDPGRSTEDKVFLLSIQEINHYFPSDTDRFCIPTSYAVEQGCKTYPGTGAGWWWTRTPGSDNYYATDVRGNGEINTIGGEANRGEIGVRPAMWISLSTPAQAEAKNMPAWKKAYSDLLMETPRIEEWRASTDDKEGKLLLCAYSLYDIDKDGIPELFLHFGDGEAVEYGRLYTFRDGNIVLLTLSRSRQLAGSGDGRWEEQFFPYGWNYFSTYPEGNGVLFAHDHRGQYFTVWSIEGEYIMESDIKLSQEYPEITAPSVAFPGSCQLTEFPAYTLLPLMMYENWAQQVEAAVEESITDPTRELCFPENDPTYFESIISGERPVIPCLIPRRYDSWKREFYSYATKQAEIQDFRDFENYLSVYEPFRYLPGDHNETPPPWPVPEEHIIFYRDLNGDRKLEAICLTRYKAGSLLFIISEQDGKAYAYGMSNKHVKNIDAGGVIYFCYPAEYAPRTMNVLYEGAFMVLFDREECFFVNIPMENYVGVRCNPEEFESFKEGYPVVYWSDPY